MKITSDEAYPAFIEVAKVRETLAQYCLAPDKVPVSLDDIEDAISNEYNAVVEKKTLPFKSDLVRGMIRIFRPDGADKTRAQIIVDADMNHAMMRLVQTKELCHVMLHNMENCTDDPTEIIAYYVQESVLVDVNGDPKLDVKNEALADLCAYELLFPHELRTGAAQKIAAKEESVFTIADWLGIPQHVVEHVLDDKYLHFADAVWARVNQRMAA